MNENEQELAWLSAFDVVREVERAHSDEPLERVAQRAYRALSAEQRRASLLRLLQDYVASERRARVREIERRAEQESRARARAQHERAEEARREAARAERAHLAESDPRYAHPMSNRYREFIATPEGAEFHAARQRRRTDEKEAAEKAKQQRADDRAARAAARRLEQDRRERREREMDEHGGPDGWYTWKIATLIGDFRREVETKTRLKLTAELLGSEFALGDGTSVTWGAATVDQHAQRVEMLQRNVQGTAATIRRHLAAVAMLAEAGASTLAEITPAGQSAA